MANPPVANFRYHIDPELLSEQPGKIIQMVSSKRPGVVPRGLKSIVRAQADYPYRESFLKGFNAQRLIDPQNYPFPNSVSISSDLGLSAGRMDMIAFLLSRRTQGSSVKRVVLTSDPAFARVVKQLEIPYRIVRSPSWVSSSLIALGVNLGAAILLVFHEPIIDTIKFWIVLPIILLSVGAFRVRCKHRLIYGIAEIGFGVICVAAAVWGFDTHSLDPLLKLFAAIYIIVRGLDNIDQGKPKPSLKDGWKERFWEDWEARFSKPNN